MPFLIRELSPATLPLQSSWRGNGSPSGGRVIKEYFTVLRKATLLRTARGGENRTVHTDRVTTPNPWVGRFLQITHHHYWECKIHPCSPQPTVGLCPKGFSGFCYRANTMPWSPETKINEPSFHPQAQNLSLFIKSSQVNRLYATRVEKSDPKKDSGLSLWKCRDTFTEHCLWFSCRVLKRLTYVMWQNLHMLQWKYIPGGCIFKGSWVIMLPFLHIYWIWCVQLCVQKTNQESKVMWNTTKYAGKVNKRNFITF